MALTEDIRWARERAAEPQSADDLDKLARRLRFRLNGPHALTGARKAAMALWESEDEAQRRLAVRLLRAFGAKLNNSFWSLFRRWIQSTKDANLRDEISEWLVGSVVCGDRSWLLVLRHWSEEGPADLRRAGVLGGLLRVRTMSDIDAAFLLAEPLMRVRDRGTQEAVNRLLAAARKVDNNRVRAFLQRWASRESSWLLQAVPRRKG